MTITQDNYLDLRNLLINELFGDAVLFTVAGMIVLTYLCVEYRLPARSIAVLNGLWIAFVISYFFNMLAWMIMLIVFAVMIYKEFSNLVQR
jgi:hypothetical protein